LEDSAVTVLDSIAAARRQDAGPKLQVNQDPQK